MKLRVAPALAVLALVAASAVSQCIAPIPTDAIAVWPFDTNAVDVAGPHTGTVTGTPVFTPAVLSNGITFNSDDDRVTIPHMADLNPAAPGFTVIFYMKGVHNQPQSQYTVVEKSHGFVDSTGWMFQGASAAGGGPLQLGMGGGGGGTFNFTSVTSSIDVLDGTFHLVAGTWSAATGMIQLFVDGISQGTANVPVPAGNTRTLNVGYAWGGGTAQRFFRGTVDHLQVYSRVMTQSEIVLFTSAANQYLSMTQHPVSHDFTVCAVGPGGSVFLVYSLDPVNGTSPGAGIWGGLQLPITDLINQLNQGLAMNPVWGGTLAPTQYSFIVPGAIMAPLSGLHAWGVAYVNGPIPGFSNIPSITFL